MSVPETLENLIAASPWVVEGKVRSQQSFWDTDNKNIYTLNEIEIFKVFQGLTPINTVHVVTRGGIVDLEMDRVSNALELQVGAMGLFMLQGFPGNLPFAGTLYRPTEGVLGFIRYDLFIGKAQGVYDSYPDIFSGLYSSITNLTNVSIFDIGPWDTEDSELSGNPAVERSIVSDQEGSSNGNFEVHAGVGDQLSITGTDFGDEPGSVLFPDANSGGNRYISALAHQIKEWSDKRIVLEVPYLAGTGKIRIDKANGESLIGEEDVPIRYDHINVQYTDNNGRRAYETQLTSDNGSGGYHFRFEADFAENAGASKAFRSLIDTWACTTGVNFQIGEVTEVDEDASDGINIVRFDNGDELGGRTLAYARSRYRGCYQGETIKWYVNEIEVVVNDDYDWYYGDGLPGASQFDFETVMLHEIGHTQQLGHVINANEVMHFAVGPQQQKRSLSHIDTIGGVFVTDKSTAEAVCGRDLMEQYDGCCETMAVVNHPSDKTLCPDEDTASFEFEVDFAEVWQWQLKNGDTWVDLNDNDIYTGTDTPKLTVERSDTQTSEFKCIASNACDESLASCPALWSVRDMDFSLTSVPATCETNAQINLDRTVIEDTFLVSVNGGASYDTVWRAGETKLSISSSPGSYAVIVEDTDTGCSVDLGTVVIQETFRLELFAAVVERTECFNALGSIRVDFNDHTYFESVLLSIDGGETFESFDDASASIVFENLENGTYEVLGMWEDRSCLITTDAVIVEKISESAHCSDMEPEDTDTPEDPDTPDAPETSDTPNTPDIPDTPEGEYEPETTDPKDAVEVSLKLYPNPTHKRINVKSGAGEILKFQLFSARGELVQEVVPQRQNEDTFFMDVAHPQTGVYSLYIITEKKNILRLVIIE